MKGYEQVVNFLWVCLGVGICFYSLRLRVWDAAGPGSGFMPFLAGAVIGVVGLALFVLTWSRTSGERAARRLSVNVGAVRRVVGILVGLSAMAVLMPVLGFLLTAVPTMTLLLRVIERQKWTWVILTALVSSVSVYWLFNSLLEMTLPRGPLGF